MSDAETAATTLCCWTASTIVRSSSDNDRTDADRTDADRCRCRSRSARFLIRSLPGDEADGPPFLADRREVVPVPLPGKEEAGGAAPPRWLVVALGTAAMGPGGSHPLVLVLVLVVAGAGATDRATAASWACFACACAFGPDGGGGDD